MNAFLAMGISTTQDSSGYFRLLPHMWPVLVVPFVCFYAILSAWVVRKIRASRSASDVQADHPVAAPDQRVTTR